MQRDVMNYDLLIVGAGPAGLTCVRSTAPVSAGQRRAPPVSGPGRLRGSPEISPAGVASGAPCWGARRS